MKAQRPEDAPLLGSKSRAERAPLSPGWGYRHVVAFMAFLGFFNVYCMRVNLSVAMVAMVNNNASSNDSGTECPDNNMANFTKKEGEFDWDSSTQGYILGSFFYGYILTQIPGGWLSEKYGGKYVFGLGVLCTALLTLVTPLAARFHVWAFILVRVLEGIGEGVTFPAMHAMWGKWAPIMERTKLTGFSYAGAQLGTVFSMPISGELCDTDFLGGWPSVFYIFGVLAIGWFLMWMLIIYNTPAEHPRISDAERDYIESGVGRKEDLSTPWGPILRSPAVWATCIAHFSNNWGFYTLLTTLPSYMKNIQKFNIQDNGILSALPYLGCWMGQVTSGFIADFLRSRGILSTLNTRRILTFLGLVTPGIMLICIQFAKCNHIAVVVLLVTCLGSLGFTMGGFQVNHIDLSPNFAGVLMGLSNSWATIPGFLGPQIVGWVTKNHFSPRDIKTNMFQVNHINLSPNFAGVLMGLSNSWATIPGFLGPQIVGWVTKNHGIKTNRFQVNHIDLSPNFAGVLMGLSNSWSTIPGFLGPQIVGWVTKNHNRKYGGKWKKTLVVSMLVFSIFFFCLDVFPSDIKICRFQVNHIDLSPNFAGVLMGLSNSWATIPGFLGPQIVGWVTKNHETRDQWQIVFYLASGIYFAGAILYVLLARGTEQPWNNPIQGISFAHKDQKSPQRRQQVQYQRTPTASPEYN